MPSLRESTLKYAKYYCEAVQRYRADDNQEGIDIDYGNIFRGIEVAEQYKDYEMLADYIKAVSDNWAGNKWDHYKHFIYLVLENTKVDSAEKIKYLTKLARIEKSQGNYDLARKILEEKFLFLIGAKPKSDSDDLFEVAMQIVDLAKRQDNLDNLESILLQILKYATHQYDIKQQVDILLELALLPEIKSSYQRSTEYITHGFKIANEIGYKIGIIDILIAKASIYIFHNKAVEAKSAYRQAWDLAVSVNDKYRINEIKKQQELLGEFMDKKVFISYNHADRNFVKKLASNLQDAGLSVWWDEWEIKVGDSIFQKISSGITSSANLIVVLSSSSIDAPWVQREVSAALIKQLSTPKGVNEQGLTILPVLLGDCDVPVLLKDIRWADFRISYKSGLTELLKALK